MYRFFLFFVLLSSTISAQESYTTYKSSLSQKPYDISISYSNDSSFTLLIDMYSLDKVNKKGGIWISSKEHIEFIEKINEAKLKYSEWVKVARENKVKNMFKEMDIQFRVPTAYFYYGDKLTQKLGANLKFEFSVIGNDMSLIIRTEELESISNKYMTHKGIMFVFTTEKEITDFLNKISTNKVLAFINQPKVKDLFKN